MFIALGVIGFRPPFGSSHQHRMRPYRNGSSDTSPGSQAVLGSALRFNATKLPPVFDGYTVLQLSDLHIETTAQCAAWKSLCPLSNTTFLGGHRQRALLSG